MVELSHPYMTTGKTIATWTFVTKVISLLFNMLSSFVIAFLPRSKVFFNFMAAVTICSDFGAQEDTVSHCFHFFPICLPWSEGPDTMILVLGMLSVRPAFSLPSFTFIKRFFSSSLLSAMVSCAYFSQQAWFQLVIHSGRHFAWCTLHRS